MNIKKFTEGKSNLTLIMGALIYLVMILSYNYFQLDWIMYVLMSYAAFSCVVTIALFSISTAIFVFASPESIKEIIEKRKHKDEKSSHWVIYHVFFLVYIITIYNIYLFGGHVVVGMMIMGAILSYVTMLSRKVFEKI